MIYVKKSSGWLHVDVRTVLRLRHWQLYAVVPNILESVRSSSAQGCLRDCRCAALCIFDSRPGAEVVNLENSTQ